MFEGTAGAVTIGGTPANITSVGGITFNTTGYTIGSGTLTLTAAPTTITTSAAAATINSVVAGTVSMTAAGTGNLTLGGANPSAAQPPSAAGR